MTHEDTTNHQNGGFGGGGGGDDKKESSASASASSSSSRRLPVESESSPAEEALQTTAAKEEDEDEDDEDNEEEHHPLLFGSDNNKDNMDDWMNDFKQSLIEQIKAEVQAEMKVERTTMKAEIFKELGINNQHQNHPIHQNHQHHQQGGNHNNEPPPLPDDEEPNPLLLPKNKESNEEKVRFRLSDANTNMNDVDTSERSTDDYVGTGIGRVFHNVDKTSKRTRRTAKLPLPPPRPTPSPSSKPRPTTINDDIDDDDDIDVDVLEASQKPKPIPSSSSQASQWELVPMEQQEQTLPPDSYSFLVCSEPFWSWPFTLGILVATLQALLFGLLTANQFTGPPNNPLDLPADVERSVRVTQSLAIFISVLVQDDLRVSLERMQEGYQHLNNFHGTATPLKWNIANILRSILGAFGLFVAFLLIIDSDDVFDLLLNFTGVAFVSELDEISFILSSRGFFGVSCQLKSQQIIHTFYPILSTSTTISTSTSSSSSSSSSSNHCCSSSCWGNRATKLGLVAACMYGGFAVIVWKQMIIQEYLCDTIHVSMSDTVLPLLGTYSGIYEVSRWTKRFNGRSSYYEQRGKLNGSTKRGIFSYCDKSNSWTFNADDSNDDDESYNPCKDYFAISEETNSFDIMDMDSDGWLSNRRAPLEGIRITCLDNTASSLSSFSEESSCMEEDENENEEVMEEEEESTTVSVSCMESFCPSLKILSMTGFDTGRMDRKVSKDFTNLPFPTYSAYDKPVFWGSSTDSKNNGPDSGPNNNNNNNPDDTTIDLVIFTGIRWILTDTSYFEDILPNTTTSTATTDTILEGVMEFFANDYFHASLLPGTGSISFVSDAINPTAVNLLSPLGLNWFSASYDDSTSQFPSADQTRPSDAVFSCTVCNKETNPCLYEGICNVNGTCTCANNAKGVLCEIPPYGDLHCDQYFNDATFDYDGGDCCGATCDGVGCGELLDTMFGVTDHVLQKFPYCNDPAMVPITIYIDGNFDAMMGIRCEGNGYQIRIGAGYTPINIPGREEIIHVKDGVQCELIFGFIYDWEDPYFEINYNVGSDIEYQILGREIFRINENEDGVMHTNFTIVSRCLLSRLTNIIDLNMLGNETSPQGKAVTLLGSFESESPGSVCGSPVLDQQYVGALLSYAGFWKPGYHCEWPIVTCNNDGGIKGIGAKKEYFPESIAVEFLPELQLLTDLEFLVLTGYSFSEAIPTWIGSFSDLYILDLGGTSITGQVPSEIGLLTNLEVLFLTGNGLTGEIPTSIGQLTKLEALLLADNFLSGPLPSQIGLMTGLDGFWMDFNNISGSIPTELGLCSNMTYMYLNVAQVTGTLPSEFGKLSNLVEVMFAANQLSGEIPSELGLLSNLSFLDLSWNLLTGKIPSQMGMLSRLNHLVLANNTLSGDLPSELGLLTQLTTLDLRGNLDLGTTSLPIELIKLCTRNDSDVMTVCLF